MINLAPHFKIPVLLFLLGISIFSCKKIADDEGLQLKITNNTGLHLSNVYAHGQLIGELRKNETTDWISFESIVSNGPKKYFGPVEGYFGEKYITPYLWDDLVNISEGRYSVKIAIDSLHLGMMGPYKKEEVLVLIEN